MVNQRVATVSLDKKLVSLAGGLPGSQVAGFALVIMERRTCVPAGASVTVNVCPAMVSVPLRDVEAVFAVTE